MNCRLVNVIARYIAYNPFSCKDSTSRISDWVDNVLTEDVTLDLQGADNVKFQNQQIQSDQTMKKKGDLAPAQNDCKLKQQNQC